MDTHSCLHQTTHPRVIALYSACRLGDAVCSDFRIKRIIIKPLSARHVLPYYTAAAAAAAAVAAADES